jgi:hypothetical protein
MFNPAALNTLERACEWRALSHATDEGGKTAPPGEPSNSG